jgi:hypothetical protein
MKMNHCAFQHIHLATKWLLVSLLDKAILGRQAVSLSLGGSVDI